MWRHIASLVGVLRAKASDQKRIVAMCSITSPIIEKTISPGVETRVDYLIRLAARDCLAQDL